MMPSHDSPLQNATGTEQLKPRFKWFKGMWLFPLALYSFPCLKLTMQRWLASYRDPSASAEINVMHYCCLAWDFYGRERGLLLWEAI